MSTATSLSRNQAGQRPRPSQAPVANAQPIWKATARCSVTSRSPPVRSAAPRAHRHPQPPVLRQVAIGPIHRSLSGTAALSDTVVLSWSEGREQASTSDNCGTARTPCALPLSTIHPTVDSSRGVYVLPRHARGRRLRLSCWHSVRSRFRHPPCERGSGLDVPRLLPIVRVGLDLYREWCRLPSIFHYARE